MVFQASHSINLAASNSENGTGSGWQLTCLINYTRDTWVKLLELPSEYASDEGLLLCEGESPNAWLLWVPNHGEITLDRSYFYC
jgi:hypothetical protein